MDSWLSQWKAQLQTSSSCGEDISFDPEFEDLRAEVEKSFSIHAGPPTDWDIVLKMCSSLLEKKSKDLWVFAYGSRAAFTYGGLGSLTTALEVMGEYIQSSWEELYPPLQKRGRRLAPLNWLCSKLENLLPADNFPREHHDIYARFKAVLTTLQALLEQKLGDTDAPSFRSILRAIPAPPAEPKEPDIAPATLPTAKENPHETTKATATKNDAHIANLEENGRVPDSILPQLLRSASDQSRQLGDHYLSINPLDWRVYVLHRVALWSPIANLPQANTNNETQLQAPTTEKRQEYEEAFTHGKYTELLPKLERSVSKAPYWFTGHYMVVQCLNALADDSTQSDLPTNNQSGAHHANLTKPNPYQSISAINFLASLFICKFPNLLTYRFKDGTPFANTESAEWLNQLLRVPAGITPEHSPSKTSSGATITVSTDYGFEKKLSQAKKLAGQGKFDAGMSILGDIVPGKNRNTIQQALAVAIFCSSCGKKEFAASLLQETYTRLEAWDLIDWEPSLSAEVITLLLKMHKNISAEQSILLKQKLTWLNARTASRF